MVCTVVAGRHDATSPSQGEGLKDGIKLVDVIISSPY